MWQADDSRRPTVSGTVPLVPLYAPLSRMALVKSALSSPAAQTRQPPKCSPGSERAVTQGLQRSLEAQLVAGYIPVPDIPAPVTDAAPAAVVVDKDCPLIFRGASQ